MGGPPGPALPNSNPFPGPRAGTARVPRPIGRGEMLCTLSSSRIRKNNSAKPFPAAWPAPSNDDALDWTKL
jgi:hypothetical protein